MPARLDSKAIKAAIKTFPAGKGWTPLNCDSLCSETKGKRDWSSLCKLDKQAGVYAFLLPRAEFPSRYTFQLHGSARRQIEFQFAVEDLPIVNGNYFVAYVGRTANLLARFQLHFQSTERSTGAQVRKALVNCGYARDKREAVNFMLEHGRVVYRQMPGDENVGNRDIIEVGLWAKYRCPFNVKSER